MEPISYLQAIILGLVQGVAEPFPISSLGHGVVLPQLFGWNIHQNDDYFLAFLVATHCATAIVLFFFFFDDWMRIFRGLGRSLRDREIGADDSDARLGWVIIIGHDPCRAAGAAARAPAAHALRLGPDRGGLPDRQRDPAAALRAPATTPAATGRLPRRLRRRIAKMSFRQALAIGTAQAAALIPGISRSGITMGGGLLVGLSNEDAARYAFLLATPIIGAAGVLKLPELMGSAGRRRPRPGACRRPRRGAHYLPRGQVPAQVLRDQPPDAVRHLLHRHGPVLHLGLRAVATARLW